MNGIVLNELISTEVQEKHDYISENNISRDNPCFLTILNKIMDKELEKPDEDLCAVEELLGNINAILNKSAKSNLIAIISDDKPPKKLIEEKEKTEIIIKDYSEIDLIINLLAEISNMDSDMELENKTHELQEIYLKTGEIPHKELIDILDLISDKQEIPLEELMAKFDMFVEHANDEEEFFTENQKDEFEINTDNGHVKKEIYAKNVSNQPSAKVEDEENITKIADEPSLQKSIQFQRKHVKLRDIKEVELKNNIQSDELYVENLNMNKTQIVLDEFSETQNLTDISDLEQNQFTEMLAEKILYSIEDNQTTATIKLEPEFLGKLDLEIVIDRGIMVAEFTVENQQVKALIEQNLTELRHNLEKNGVFVEGFNVSVNHHDKGDPHQRLINDFQI